MAPAIFVGDHVLESDQKDFIAEFVFWREYFVRLVDFFANDVVGEAGLKDPVVSGHLLRNEGYLLQRR